MSSHKPLSKTNALANLGSTKKVARRIARPDLLGKGADTEAAKTKKETHKPQSARKRSAKGSKVWLSWWLLRYL